MTITKQRLQATLLALLTMLIPLYATAKVWDETLYNKIEKSIVTPLLNNAEYRVTNYGANPANTAAKNQRAIQRTIDRCSKHGGGRVVVPKGMTILTGALQLKDGVNLVIEEGAVLSFVFQPELYPIVETSWEGLDCFNLSPCLYAFRAHDIAVTGKGTIDGGGNRQTWWPWCGATKYGWHEGIVSQKLGGRARLLQNGEDGEPMRDAKGRPTAQRTFTPKDGMRPQLIGFNQCQRVLITDVTLLSSPFWVIHPLKCTDVIVRGVHINNDGPNGDGCDPESCDRVLIENCYFNTGDDCIAIKSGRNRDGRERAMASQNIIIRNCEMRNGHGGVVIGSEISGGCRNVFAHDCTMDSPYLDRVLRIKTNSCRGGIIENIFMKNINVGQCRESVLKINLDYEHREICCRGNYPTVRNVTMENVRCQSSRYGVQIIGLDEDTYVHDIFVRNCRFNGVKDGNTITGKTRDIRFDNLFINGERSFPSTPSSIDRKAVLLRNSPKVTAFAPLNSLSVGNGHFATTVDITGMQSFPELCKDGVPLTAMSDWAWHSFPNTDSLTTSETQRTFRFPFRNHDETYAVEYKKGGRQQAATQYYRINPHRLNLGTIGLVFTDAKGDKIGIQKIKDINQTQNLCEGSILSRYSVMGSPVNVTTSCRQSSDAVVYRIFSPLLSAGKAKVSIRFSYPTGKHADDANDWNSPNRHTSTLINKTSNSATISRTIDHTTYFLTLRWEGHASVVSKGKHEFILSSPSDTLCFEAEYSATRPDEEKPFNYLQTMNDIRKSWNEFWQSGGFIDFSQCTDPRAHELERRVVLSQYLTKINCANSLPPQETGLTYNSWFGRPHLEMTWWHSVHFALWNNSEILATILDWYNHTAYSKALDIAQRQGFDGIRWMKMTDPSAGEAPSNTGSFLIWQQPHYIYMAEEMYRAVPSETTLTKYAQQVEKTARFMADFVCTDSTDNFYHLKGSTAMQESMSKGFSYDHPFELAYWKYGLAIAQQWRERQGKPRDAHWDDIINRLAPLPEQDGIYRAGRTRTSFNDGTQTESFNPFLTPEQQGSTSISYDSFMQKSRSDHPAILGVCGMLPDMGTYSPALMSQTLKWTEEHWNWDTTWGWDYGMAAMAAARLGNTDEAINLLLSDKQKNRYLISGHNFQTSDRLRIYLPGNGSLLTAIAMMCAGWDGCTDTFAPGFPHNGKWNVRWEGLNKMQ